MRALVLGTWLATGAVFAGPPGTSELDPLAAELLLRRLTVAIVTAGNCPEVDITISQWKFLSDTADQLANQLDLDSARYDTAFYGPAIAGLDIDGFCATEAPKTAPLVNEMVAAGGVVEKYKPGAL